MDRWIKTTSLAAFTVALALFAATSSTQADVEPQPSPPAAVEPAPPLIDDPAVQPACSPPPQCYSNKSCDRICGKGLGTCVRINSCYSECSCAAAL